MGSQIPLDKLQQTAARCKERRPGEAEICAFLTSCRHNRQHREEEIPAERGNRMGRAGLEPAPRGLKVRIDNTQRDAPS
jgi:hypothetical protein